jgi:hypothetical protein
MLSEIGNIPRTEYEFVIPSNLSLPELVLDSRSLEYGFYAVKARLQMKGHPDIFNEDTKYFHVVATPFLEPALVTGFMYTVIFREMVSTRLLSLMMSNVVIPSVNYQHVYIPSMIHIDIFNFH